MKLPEETTQDRVSNSSADRVASSQKRRPPKLRPSKLAKRTTPSDGQNEGSEQRQIGGSDRKSQSSSPTESPNGVIKDPSPDSLTSPSLEKTPENPQIHRTTRIRRESAQSAEPDRVDVIEREQRADSPESGIRETRVRQMLSPEVQNKEIVRAPDSHPAGQQGELLQNGTNPNPGQVIETTEEVTNTKGNDQLKLRLDLNLDIEIELKAKIRGDLTLQLLQ